MLERLSRGVRSKSNRRARFIIKDENQLAQAMDGGRRLVQTNGPRGPSFTVEGGSVDPIVVEGTLAKGRLQPCDRGLFNDRPLSWTMVDFGQRAR